MLPRASRPSLTGRKVPDENVCNVCGALGLSYEVSRTVQTVPNNSVILPRWFQHFADAVTLDLRTSRQTAYNLINRTGRCEAGVPLGVYR